MRIYIALIVLLAGLAPLRAAEPKGDSVLPNAVVTIEVTRRQYDFIQPWSKRVEQVQKTGTLIGSKQILTTAEFLPDQTLIRLQKGGRGKWWKGELVWIDYYSNLALVTSSDPEFWAGTDALKIAETAPTEGDVQLVRWRNGNLDIRKAEVNRLIVKRGKLSYAEHVQMEIDTEVTGTGWAEAIVSGKKLIGITSSKEEHGCTVIPCSFIHSCLEARKKGPYRGLGYFAFVWQRGENPAIFDYFKFKGEPRGVLIIETPHSVGEEPALHPHDVILQIDGFDIDTNGDYKDPAYGNLSLENLATRKKWAGDVLRIKVWRAEKNLEIDYKLPKADFRVDLIPEELFDQEPEYVLLGGLLFQPLSQPYLRSWGADWARKAPFRLSYYTREKASKEKPSLIMLSSVLPDPVNLGYQDARYLAVDKLNGQRIRTLSDILLAKEKPVNGFHVLEFQTGETLHKLVLDASEAEVATQRVLQRYGMDKDHLILPPRTDSIIPFAKASE